MKARPNITNANLRFKMAFEVNKGQNYWEDRFFFRWVNNQIINNEITKFLKLFKSGKVVYFKKAFILNC